MSGPRVNLHTDQGQGRPVWLWLFGCFVLTISKCASTEEVSLTFPLKTPPVVRFNVILSRIRKENPSRRRRRLLHDCIRNRLGRQHWVWRSRETRFPASYDSS